MAPAVRDVDARVVDARLVVRRLVAVAAGFVAVPAGFVAVEPETAAVRALVAGGLGLAVDVPLVDDRAVPGFAATLVARLGFAVDVGLTVEAGLAADFGRADVVAAGVVIVAGVAAAFGDALFEAVAPFGAAVAARDRLVAAFGAAVAAGFEALGGAPAAFVAVRDALAFDVDRRVVGFVAAVPVAAGFGRFREPGGRPRRRGAAAVEVVGVVDASAAASACRIGVRTWLACTAADPTVRAAPPTAPPTAPAADEPAETALDAAPAASDATLDASVATSDSDSATCFRRFATSFLPLPATALASCLTRFDSVFRAAASFFSTFRSSFAALFGSGATTPLASTMTSATVSTTTPRRPLFPPSSRFAIDRPPACPMRSRPTTRTAGPTERSLPRRRQVCHLGQELGGASNGLDVCALRALRAVNRGSNRRLSREDEHQRDVRPARPPAERTHRATRPADRDAATHAAVRPRFHRDRSRGQSCSSRT